MHQSTLKNLHEPLKDRINKETYDNLSTLYQIATGNSSIQATDYPLKSKLPEDWSSPVAKMQASIYYARYCRFIDSLLRELDTLEQYKGNADLQKNMVDYYLSKNSLKELTPFGLGWFYDVKFRKHTATLYSVGYGKDSTWNEWIKKQNIQSNTIKENGLQRIFSACRAHINRGGDIRLKSLSKCFGVDLFKYMHLDENEEAHIYIIQNAPINFLAIDGKEASIYEYLMSDIPFNEKFQFCLDFGSPRDKKIPHYNSWSKRFLGDSTYISEQECIEKKNDLGNLLDPNLGYEILAYLFLEQERAQEGNKSISSRISPIADQEVIVSDTLWDIVEYESGVPLKSDDMAPCCIHFKLNQIEYAALIFTYFQQYAKVSTVAFSEFSKHYSEYIDSLIKILENPKFDGSDDTSSEETHQNAAENNKLIALCLETLKQHQQDIMKNKEISPKVEALLSLIDWEAESFPHDWSIENIYSAKTSFFNALMNLYKCNCKQTILKNRIK